MVKSGSFSFAGRDHGHLPERSDDVVLERDCGTHKVVVLCNGGGDGRACGKAAAQLTAGALAGFLSFRFQRCMADKPAVLWRESVNLIAEALNDAARQVGAGPGSFGCSVMAAAMDQQGRWCLFHLGGGTAVGKVDPAQDWAVISHPQPVMLSEGASLTVDCPMFKNLHFYRQTDPSNRSLCLVSCGALEWFRTAPQLPEKPEPGRGLPKMENLPEDDCSLAWLIARQEC